MNPCSRRQLLLGTATTFAGAMLIACGSDKVLETSVQDIPVGSAKLFKDFIITQPVAGEYHAYVNRCTHKGTRITTVDGDKVRCPEHRSEFSIKDGAPLSGPAKDPLEQATLEQDGDTLRVSRT